MVKDLGAEIKQLADLLDEQMLASTILRYARSGHATTLMVEQALALTVKNVAYAIESGDHGLAESAARLKAGLEQALIDGVETLRIARAPGPETTEVEDPLAAMRRAARHNIRRQIRCASGVIDIFDLTSDEIIECKHLGTSAALGEAAGQLHRYAKSFPGSSLCIAVLRVESDGEWLAGLLRQQGITIIEIEKGGGA